MSQPHDKNIMPVRRNLEFKLPADKISDWHDGGMHISHFFNALSLLFPDGERFFIDSVRNYRDQITDPELQEQIRGFIGQEAMHGREHEEYNQALIDKGLPAKRYLRRVKGVMKFGQKYRSKAFQLAGTAAAEHLTAILANQVLKHPEDLERCDPRFAAIWHWHALEETEHKAVAFDVYQQVFGTGFLAWLRRCWALVISTNVFFFLAIPFHIGLVRAEGGLWNLRAWAKVNWFLWGNPGVFRRALPDWFAWFRPGFHPWDDDNSRYLEDMDAVVNIINDTGTATA